MNKKERHSVIRDLIYRNPYVTKEEIFKLFPDVSLMTVHRDLAELEEAGDLLVVRGGVRSMKFLRDSAEDSFSKRMNANIDEKDKIALIALTFISERHSFFIDSGSTAYRLAKIFPEIHTSVTTTSPGIATELAQKSNLNVYMVGGLVHHDSFSVAGTQAQRFLESVNIDIAFLVPSGFTAEDGFTCGNYAEYELKQYVVSKAKCVIMLMDSSKIGKSLPYTFARPENVNILILDRSLQPEAIAAFKGIRQQIIQAAP